MLYFTLKFKWTISRARDSEGYNICTLRVDGAKVASTCGGGYDMAGTVFGNWIAKTFEPQLLKLKKEFYGLTWHNPKRDISLEEVPGTGETVQAREIAGKSVGLERYQAFYRASSKVPTDVHVIPLLDGACGSDSMKEVLTAIGGSVEYVKGGDNAEWLVVMPEPEKFDPAKMGGVVERIDQAIARQRNSNKLWSQLSIDRIFKRVQESPGLNAFEEKWLREKYKHRVPKILGQEAA